MEKLKKKYEILSICRMYTFILLLEILNVSYSFLGNDLFYPKLIMLTFLSIVSIFVQIFYKKIKYENYILFFLLFSYIVFFIYLGLNNVEVFTFFFYLLEVSIILIFSEFKLLTKYLVQLFYLILAIFFTGILHFTLDYFAQQFIQLITFTAFCLFLIYFSQNLSLTLLDLLEKSEAKTFELDSANSFLKTIMRQEQIKLMYVYPKSKKAYLIESNIDVNGEKNVENIFEYLRKNKIVPIEYFGLIQESLNIAVNKGSASIIIPLSIKGGEPYWAKINGTLIKENGGNEEKIIVSAININEIKNVELKFKDALTKCSIATWEVDIENDTIIEYSDPILEYYFFGAIITNAKDTIVNRNIIYYEDIDKFKETIRNVDNGIEDVNCEIRIFPTRNSSYTWVKMHFTCINDSNNKPSKAWVAIENINDSKTSEKLFEVERKRNFGDKSGLIIMMEINVSRDFVIDYSSKFEKLSVTPSDNSIKNILDSILKTGIIITHDKQIYEQLSQEYLLDCYSKGKRTIEDNFKIITKNDDIIFISHIIKLFMNSKTKEIIAFSYFYDITDKAISQLSLDSIIKSKFVFLAFINLLNSHITIHKTNFRELYLSNSSDINYEKEWRTFSETYIHPEDREFTRKQINLDNVRRQLRYKNHFSFEYRINKNGNMISMRRCHLIKTTNNDPIILLLEENITSQEIDRIRKQLVLKDALQKAEQAADAKSEFLSRMSHEIRTPLSAIIGLSELGISISEEESRKYFKTINDSSNYLLSLLNDILVMNKLELGQVKLNFEYVNIDEFNKFIIEVTKNQAQKKNIKFTFNQDESYSKYQKIERLRFQQIIINIINNAIKYTPNNGEVSYTIKYVENNGKLYSQHIIKDNGVGISKDFMKFLYTPFARERNSLSDTEGGTGLGLAICSNLVKQLAGSINIESELNKGTTVTIDLPIEEVSEDNYLIKKESKNKTLVKTKTSLEKTKILIAEDHDINATVIRTMLNQFGIPNERVNDGEEVVNRFKNSKKGEFNLILMDIMMPKLDGLQATNQIRNLDREDSKTVKIIALSANAFDEDVERSYEYGMDDYLKKPINKNILISLLNKYL